LSEDIFLCAKKLFVDLGQGRLKPFGVKHNQNEENKQVAHK